ncbi:MAG TPA: tRNA pseudouridine(55) synthase TruB [Anaeromyxobacteraceae bacterium]|nr:tRNA pseudouridine(55) synthase TruB [Anaeromyxobacteraceae bacterium]
MTGGVLVVDKPAGPTSFEVVKRVRRLLRAEKAGHAGTLDPAATGVLAICVDDAVKVQRWLADGDKAYEATVAFGAATTTEDAEGEVVERGDASALDAATVRSALPRFTGEIEQVPPMYSAVRVGGRRLHEAARAGEEVERAPRRVRVDSLDLLGFEPAGADGLARAGIAVRCGKGTYVRTLAAGLGRAVGVPAHLAALRRTEASGFALDRAITLAEAEALARAGPDPLRARLVPPAEALSFLPAVAVDDRESLALAQGKALPRDAPAGDLLRAIGPRGDLVALLAPAPSGLRPVRVFVTGGE